MKLIIKCSNWSKMAEVRWSFWNKTHFIVKMRCLVYLNYSRRFWMRSCTMLAMTSTTRTMTWITLMSIISKWALDPIRNRNHPCRCLPATTIITTKQTVQCSRCLTTTISWSLWIPKWTTMPNIISSKMERRNITSTKAKGITTQNNNLILLVLEQSTKMVEGRALFMVPNILNSINKFKT